MTPAETSPPAPPPRATHPVSTPLLLQDPTTQATPPWREQLTLRGIAVAAVLGALLCVVIHRLNLTVGVIPALNVASGLLAFFLAAAWRAAAGRLGFGRGPPFTRQENTIIQTCAIACAGLAFSGCSASYIFAMDRKTYELVGPDYPGNRAEDVRDPSLAWMISFLFLIALVGPFSIVLLRKVMVIDYKLTFPGGTATALMINSLHGKTEGNLAGKKVHCLVKYMGISFVWSCFKWFFSGVGDSCGFDNFPTFGIEAFKNTFYFDFSPSYVGFGLISPHIVNCSVFLGSVISWGFLWPFISAQAGHWYPDNLGNSDFRGLYGYKVFIAISIILGDGLYNLVKIFVVIAREFCGMQSKKRDLPVQALEAEDDGSCEQLAEEKLQTKACSTRQKGAEASSSRRWAAMEMLSMLKVGYTILRSETPATDLVNTFMDWAARRSLVLLAIFLPPYYIYKLTTAAFAAAMPEDVAGKVALVTGASSGIGEQIAYQYAKKGARLALVARRVGSLHDVAERAKDVGSPNVLVVAGDVANPEDCQRFVQATVDHFGRLDHLVNNAGVANVCWFEEVSDVADLKQVLAVNFWGAVHPTHCVLPHVKKSGGKIFVNSSAAAVLAMPRMSFYNASKAAVLNFFETLRMELGDEVGITIATPGWIESEMTKGKHLSKEGTVEVDQDTRDAQVGLFPVVRTARCAEDIVDAICRGRRHLTVPLWYRALFLWRTLAPEVTDSSQRLFYRRTAGGPGNQAKAKRFLEFTGAKGVLQPASLHSSDIKRE